AGANWALCFGGRRACRIAGSRVMQPSKTTRKHSNGVRRAPPPPLPANGPEVTPAQLSALLQSLQAMKAGDFSVRLSPDHAGAFGKIADTFNDIVAANEQMAQQLERVGQVVGREGKTRHRVKFALGHGAWSEMETSVNT